MTSSRQMKTNILDLYIRPGSARTEIEGFYKDRIKIRLTSPPERGKANRELVNLLSRITGIPRSKIKIISGITSNYKRVCINGDNSRDYSKLILNNS